MKDRPNLEGRTLSDRYFLRSRAGRGGTADVYQAWDRMRGTSVAVKILDYGDHTTFSPSRVFRQEAKMLKELEHDNIVRLFEIDKDGALMYIVMQWVDGVNLRDEIQSPSGRFRSSQPVSNLLWQVSTILEAVCTALRYTHASNFLHRDIKSANILLHRDGRIYLSDFGIAGLANDHQEGGTPYYMAPELVDGSPATIATEIYALGVTLFEMLSSGVMPYRGDSHPYTGQNPQEKLEQQRALICWEHGHLQTPMVTQVNAQIPAAVARVVMRAMDKIPHNRQLDVFSLLNEYRLGCGSQLGSGASEVSETDTALTMTTMKVNNPLTFSPTELAKGLGAPKPSRDPDLKVYKGAHLLGASGQFSGQIIFIPRPEMLIGRSESCQLRIPDQTVSRRHAAIIRTKRGACYIQDTGSKTGTFVNGIRVVGPLKLNAGDVIQISAHWAFKFFPV